MPKPRRTSPVGSASSPDMLKIEPLWTLCKSTRFTANAMSPTPSCQPAGVELFWYANGTATSNCQSAPNRFSKNSVLLMEPAPLKGQVFELSDELTVGRAPGCGVPLPDDTFVSQLHARVFRRDGGLFVEDLGSTNGTFLNSKPVSTAVPLRKGDRLQVGKTVLELPR